jgi:hypothetical protein
LSKTYTLKHPIFDFGEPVTVVSIRRVKGKDLRKMAPYATPEEKSLAAISALTGLSQTAVDELDAEDIEAISEIIQDFTQRSQATGNVPAAS